MEYIVTSEEINCPSLNCHFNLQLVDVLLLNLNVKRNSITEFFLNSLVAFIL